ncbi:Melanopsin [Kappamyces sp. JEL0829]|nr:Melanopsin [Kappamyces sp. JEL0829]
MTIISETFSGSATVPFFDPVGQSVIAAVALLFGSVGLLANVTILLTNVTRPSTPSSLLVLSLCWSDFLSLIMSVMFCPMNLFLQGWAFGTPKCIFAFFLTFNGSFASVAGISSLALERYLSVCRGIRITQRTAWLWVVLIWTPGLSISMIPFITSAVFTSISLDQSYLFCMFAWYSNTPAALAATILSLVLFVSTLVIMMFCYWRVFRTFNKAMRSNLHAAKTSQKIAMKLAESKVLQLCVVLTASFFVGWGPEALKILYELVTRTESPVWLAYIGSLIATMHFSINPFLLIIFDNRIKRNVLERIPRLTAVFGAAAEKSGSSKVLEQPKDASPPHTARE